MTDRQGRPKKVGSRAARARDLAIDSPTRISLTDFQSFLLASALISFSMLFNLFLKLPRPAT